MNLIDEIEAYGNYGPYFSVVEAFRETSYWPRIRDVLATMKDEIERLRDELSAAHASGVKVGLERAREICEDRATRLMQAAVHSASYGATQCADAIQREIDKHA